MKKLLSVLIVTFALFLVFNVSKGKATEPKLSDDNNSDVIQMSGTPKFDPGTGGSGG